MTKSPMLEEHESLYLAKVLIEEHGELAADHARRQAEQLLREANVEGGAAWLRVARAVDMLLDGQIEGWVEGRPIGRGAGTLH